MSRGTIFASGMVVGALAVGIPCALALDGAAKCLELHARIIATQVGVQFPYFDKAGRRIEEQA